METTTNYGLKKYQVGDLFNPLTINNPNVDDIDADMKSISDRAVGRATELVSQGVHAITVLDTDCKTIKWVATANFTAGETFTINGIQCNAYLPSGESLGTNAYVSGAQVIASLNNDNSAMTVYVPQGAVAVASDSERLGGELPSYYATKEYADGIKTTADTASELIGKKALVNTYYDSSVNKLYQVNADGTVGGEISMGMPNINYASPIKTFSNNDTFTASKECYLLGVIGAYASSCTVSINNNPVFTVTYGGASGNTNIIPLTKINAGDVVTVSGFNNLKVYETI